LFCSLLVNNIPDLTTLLQHTIPPLLPALPITPSLSFHYIIDALILSSSSGNLTDALFLSVRSALFDLKIPRTRNVAYEAKEEKDAQGDSDMAGIKGAALGKKKDKKGEAGMRQAAGAEFEIEDYWDEGDPLEDRVREELPVCITMNIVSCASRGRLR
jgi:exosome complex component RRP42